MKFIQSLQPYLIEGNDMSGLPDGTLKEIQSNIRKGAEDKQQSWANALALVHKAYEVTGVERPDPSMKEAWKQYEEMIQYAVEQLAHYRGLEADWRMSSAMFHEAEFAKKTYRAEVSGPNVPDTHFVVTANNRQEVVRAIKEQFKDNYEIKSENTDDGGVKITFWRMGIRTNNIINVKPARYIEED